MTLQVVDAALTNQMSRHRDEVWRWFQDVVVSYDTAYVKLCAEGNLIEPGQSAGLGWAALGLKLCTMLRLFELATPGFEENLVARVQSFQLAEGPFAGQFVDREVLRQVEPRRFGIWTRRNLPVRHAETRQAFTALYGAGHRPLYPLPTLVQSAEDVRRYLHKLDWLARPWAAGSHASLLAVFLSAGGRDDLLQTWFEVIDGLFRQETGGWYLGDQQSHIQIINGAMKVYTAYNFLEMQPPGTDKAIDFVLRVGCGEGGCNIVDGIYVLHTATQWTEHRRDEVREFCLSMIPRIEAHRHKDGGLSYGLKGTQRDYYGAKVSKGMKGIGDLHGTKLLTWAFVLIADVLGLREDLGWRIPVA
ncbi:MAG: hypothetical protein WAU86_04690 [Oricola sp.]